jgi:predicted RNase H-like HicB family nuclease
MGESRRQLELTAVYRKVPEGYIGFIEELPGANSQGRTLEEVRSNLREAAVMVLEANRELARQSMDEAEVIREPLRVAAA